MLRLHVDLKGFKSLHYEKKPIRKALRQQGGEVRNLARRLVTRRGVSDRGEFPGLRTGLLRRSIRSNVLRGALAVVVEPQRKVLQSKRSYRDAAYPWILAAGTRKAAGKRADYVEEALGRRAQAATDALRSALQGSLSFR